MMWARLIQCSKPSLAIMPLQLPPAAPDAFRAVTQLFGPPPSSSAAPAAELNTRRSTCNTCSSTDLISHFA